jgi:hypothetical protein
MQFVDGLPPQFPVFDPGSGHVRFYNKVILKLVSSEDFGFPCQSFHRVLQTLHRPLSGVGTIVKILAEDASGISHPTSRNWKLKSPRKI